MSKNIKVTPKILGEEYDAIDQQFAFSIVVSNEGAQPVKVKEIGLMQPKSQKFPLRGLLLTGADKLPAELGAGAKIIAVFHPEFDRKQVYTSVYAETEDGTIIEGKGQDLALLNEY